MKLYKYKSLKNDGMATTLDIIVNKRLYLSDWDRLNDPMEGAFVLAEKVASELKRKQIRDELIREKRRFKVCSLSANGLHPLMWSHYGDGHTGACIELEISELNPDLKTVNYDLFPPYIDSISTDWAMKTLTTKGKDWAYENEFRIITNSENNYYSNISIKSVSVGMRCTDLNRSILKDVAAKNGLSMHECFCAAGYALSQIGPPHAL